MQKTFGKIIGELQQIGDIQFSGFTKPLITVDDAIKIVKQEVEKYNDGWIPVSEKLPEEKEDVEVTVEEIADEVGGKRYYNVRSWLQDEQWVIKKNPYHPTVIAWKYPTEPYKVGIKNVHTKKTQTNADKIRNMTDEELADMFHNNGSYTENGEPKLEMWVKEKQIIIDDSFGIILEWLKSESEE